MSANCLLIFSYIMTVKTFIDRPILACVISVLILITGVISLLQLPIEQYPDIAPPTVRVSASYTGANAETLLKSVVVPLEEAINGVDNMMYMTSSATNNGSAKINVYFKQGTDPDMATVNVQNRIATAQGKLPAEVTKSGITVTRRQTSVLKSIGLYSPHGTYDNKFLNNYMKINIEPRLSRIAGVGEVDVNGSDYSLRIWLDPNKMSQYGLEPSDVSQVLDEQNIEAPTGTLGADAQNTYQYVLKYRGRYETPEEFGNLVVKSLADGTVLRIKDLGRVELGLQSYNIVSMVNGKPGAMCFISQTPGSNANQIITEIDKTMDEIQQELPPDMQLVDLMSTKSFLDASISEVVRTLIEAILLVILVVYIFLQNMRSTIIPAISIIVSLVGTFAFLRFVGFSINLLTLFALVLVIGTVVDDAIVVVEAVQSKFDSGYKSPYKATIDAMHDITSALVTTTLVFMAVFIPVCFMGGTAGVFYTQFGLTMAAAVCISMFNALTLSPALCSLFMTPHKDSGKMSFSSRFHRAFNTAFSALVQRYSRGVQRVMGHRYIIGGLLVVALLAFYGLMRTTKTGLVPDEDMGSIYVSVQSAPGSSLAETSRIMAQVEKCVTSIDELKAYSKVNGSSRMAGQGPSNGMFVLRLKPWNERAGKEHTQKAIMTRINKSMDKIKGAKIMVSAQPMISGYGSGNGFEMYVQDKQGGSIEQLLHYTNEMIDRLNQRPEISKAQTSFALTFPQYLVDVDAAQCLRAGISPEEVLTTLSGYVGGSYASNMNRFSKLYRVIVQASPEFRLNEGSLHNMYVRSSNGEMAPLSQFLRLKRVYGAENLTRFNLLNAIRVNGQQADGYSSGQALQAVAEVAKEVLPAGYGYEYAGMSREEAGTSRHTTLLVFLACIVFIYLILCALYESLFVPFAVILSVPFGLLGCFLFAHIMGVENNIYMQTGIIMLIGLLSKTAILLTEYAVDRRKQGQSIREAAIGAARVRLRPILMTSLTMIIGLLPLMFVSGPGANSSLSLATGTIGGMFAGTIALLFVVPTFYIVCQTVHERLAIRRKE